MPRSSSSSSSPSRPRPVYPTPSRSRVSAPAPSRTAPAPVAPAVQQHNVKVEQPGFFTNVWQGFGLGAGQAIAHNIFRRDPVPPQVSPAPTQVAVYSEPTKHTFPKEFDQCMKDNNDTELCKQFL